jgi:ribosomal protein S18 acetylase RimI-like enzyme
MVQRRRIHIETVVVCCKHRRKGIGRRLMDEAVTWGRDNGAVEVVLTTWVGNDDAEAFYARLGYRELSRVLFRPIA